MHFHNIFQIYFVKTLPKLNRRIIHLKGSDMDIIEYRCHLQYFREAAPSLRRSGWTGERRLPWAEQRR